MLESRSDIWGSGAYFVCVTTNGMVKRNGALVMGAGFAKQVRDRYPGIDLYFGNGVRCVGNVPQIYSPANGRPYIMSLPTKHDWRDKSDLELIIQSVKHIVDLMGVHDTIALTRPGCALGGLDWDTTVKPAIEPLLDDRFTVYHR